jgi:hypothetical protein
MHFGEGFLYGGGIVGGEPPGEPPRAPHPRLRGKEVHGGRTCTHVSAYEATDVLHYERAFRLPSRAPIRPAWLVCPFSRFGKRQKTTCPTELLGRKIPV